MASPLDLTNLADVKAWLSVTTGASDGMLGSLITASSRMVYSYLSRPSLLPRLYSERYDGNGSGGLLLRQWPVLSISALLVNDVAVPAAPAPIAGGSRGSGYLLQPWDGTPPGANQRLDLFAYALCRGRQNVAVSYQAGYAVQAEAHTIPGTPYQAAAQAPYGAWASDQGVVYAATGVALSAVTGTPAAGQYALATVNGVQGYQFAAADTGAAVLISYGFVPQDLAQVCLELVGERFRYRSRIGEVSHVLSGQETVAFSQKPIPDSLKLMLQPYKAVVVPA